MAISPKDAIRKFKVELLQELPLDDPIFFAMVERADLFPMDTGNIIRAEKSRAHKVDYFLQQVVEPGAEDYLPRLLQLMKESKVANVEKLADDIQAAVAPGLLSSDSDQNELAVFKESYALLCNTITDINELLKYFVTEKIITTDAEEEIKTYTTKSERVSKLLLNISGPLEAGDSNGFYTMLQIMKTHGVDATQRLANQMITRVDKFKLPILINTGITSISNNWSKELSHCRLHIQEIYKTTRFNIQKDIWQLLHPKHFVNVLLIHHSDHNTGKEFFYVATMMKYGLALSRNRLLTNRYNETTLIGEYLESFTKSKGSFKTIKTNAISDIFQPFKNNDGNTTNPKYILIEGAPGMGKTTLCKEIAYQWAENSLLKDTELLFLIYLHDPAIKNINHLKDLVHYQYDFLEENDELSKQCAKFLNFRNGIDLTIVFDGYDEYNSSSDSIITKILDRKVLPQCRILITSRLTASNRLRRLADVRVEVLGFTDESKAQYIKQELKDHPDEINELQTYLNTHPSIKSICYMPMMMTILVYMFKEKGCLPNNSTELYDKFIALTMCHHLQKHNILGDVFVSLQALPIEYNSVLTDLSKFAFLTLQNKQKVFSKKDIKNLCPNSSLASFNLETFGFINSVKYFCIDKGDSHVFSFLHLSIHEYLAAYYLSSIDQCGQFKELETTFLNEMYQETWNMFINMNKDTWFNVQNYFIYCKDTYRKSLSHWISNIKSSVLESFVELYDTLSFNTLSKKVIQVLFFKNDQYSNSSTDAHQEKIYISLCDQKNLQLELLMINKDIKGLNSNWYILFQNLSNKFSMVFYNNDILILNRPYQEQIVDFFKHNTLLTYIMLKDCHITRNTIGAIKLSCFQHLLHLQITNCTIDCNAFTKLTDFLSSISTLFSITVNQRNKFSAEWIKVVSSVIVRNCNLKILNLSNNRLQNEIIEVVKALEHTTTLEVLNLTKSNIQEGAAAAISAIINSNTSLREFYIANNNLKFSIVVILKFLNKTSSLKVLDLSDNKIPEEAGDAIASVVLHNPRLEELYLNSNNLNAGILKVAKALQHISTLRILDLRNNNIPQEACDELALAIKSNKHLETLRLDNNDLHSSPNIILSSLTTITTLTVLALDNNEITQEAGEALASIILRNTGLEELYLNSNSLGIGTLKLAKALQHITTLQILGLGNNKISQEACDEIALAIKSNKHLKKLGLNHNNLQFSANAILNSLTAITTLTTLILDNNKIPQEADEPLASVIMHNTGLKELCLNDNNLGMGTLKIAKALQQITTLRILHLSNNSIPQEACDELALAIKSNKQLEELKLSVNNISLFSANTILYPLTTITTLTGLDLNNNQITKEADEALTSVTIHNTGLEELGLNDYNLDVGTLKIAKGLQQITTLRVIDLGNNDIPQEACDQLAEAIKLNKHLERLWLCNDNLHSSAIVILSSLTTLTTLTVLGLNNNQIPQEADEALASVIMHNTGLEELHFNDNNLGIGTLKVAKALQQITTLRILHLSNNNIPQEACDELALAIKLNRHLEVLNLSVNNISHSSENFILTSLSTIKTLTGLGLNYNQITEGADEALASVIVHNTGLEELYLNGTNLGVGTLKVAQALQHITTLRMLSLDNNNIPQEACDELALAIKSNKYLKKLWLNDNNLHSSVNIILNSLTTINTLMVLNLSHDRITEGADEALASVIMHNTRLEELYLDGNNLGVGTLKLAQALQHIAALRKLSLDNNNIPQEACGELALAIKSNKHLKMVCLNDNNLHSSVNIIVHSLTTIKTLTVFGLNNNQIPQEADEALASVIVCNTELEELYLYGNNLGVGTLKVAKALQHITTLRILGLGNNNIQPEACNELAMAIKSNKYLKKLWLNDNNLHSSVNIILKSLTTITTLTVLNLNNNQIPQEADELLASVIMCNTGLEELCLDGNNLGVGTLKIAQALQHITTLRMLSLDNNNIPHEACNELAMAIKSNKQLKKLWLNNNNLHSSVNIILKSLTTITTLTVLNLNNNQITQEANEVLVSVIMCNTGLEELFLNDNNIGVGTLKLAKALRHITTLRILCLGKNSNIPQEACDELSLAIKSNKHLKRLLLSDNNLRSSANIILKSLSTITTLTVLALNNNQIPQEADEALASVIVHNTGLEELYVSSNDFGIGILKIVKALQHISTLRILGLSNNNIPQEACDELALAIKANKHLKSLCLNDNNLCSSTIVILKILSTITTLTVLNLNNNQITQEADEALASVIKLNTGLSELYLYNNNLGVGTLKLAQALQHITKLKILCLGNNNIPQEACDEFALAFKSNRHLEKLWLSDSNLYSSAIVILNSLTTITTLTGINLDNNQIPREADEVLASVIMHNTGLEELYLSGNNLGVGTLKVAKALQCITTLRILGLGNNNIPQETCDELALAIKSNKHLKQLGLKDNNLQYSSLLILQTLSTISTLKVLDIQCNQIGKKGGKVLVSVIKSNNTLMELYLGSNDLQGSAISILEALQNISTLELLDFSNNNLLKEFGDGLTNTIQSNNNFKHLFLRNNNLQSSIVIILQSLRTISNLNTLNIYGNTITEEAGNMLASVISRNVELQKLELNLLIAPLKVIEALQNLSALQTLVFCTCNISEQIEIKMASVITKNKSLTWLSLPNIKFSQYVMLQAMTTISNLTTIWLEDNLLSEQMSDDLSLAIKSNKSLENLILLDNMLQTGLMEIVKVCNKLSNIKVLQLAHNCIIPIKVVELTSIITQNTSLERVLLGGITLNAAESFHLNVNTVLHKTDITNYCNNTSCVISSNHCTSLEVIYLEMLRKQIDNTRKCLNDVPIHLNAKNFSFVQKIYHYYEHKNNTQLKIQQAKQKLEQVDAQKVISSLCILEKVKVIDLENNNVDEDASFELAIVLHSNNVLEQLWLRGNRLHTAGALYILNSLEYLTTLRVLDLSYNNIGSESADGIAAVIDNNPLINQLWLDGNDLYSTGIIIICNALKKIRTLCILSLCNNGITDDAADELSAVITQNILLDDLLLSNNQLHYTGIKIIAKPLSKLIKLRKLDLFNNNIAKEGASSLAIVLQNSTSLQDLFLSSNNLETSGALEICNALSHINSLHVFTLSNNDINDEVTSQLIEVLNNNHLYALLIGGNGLECGALKIAQVIENDNIAMQLLDFSNNNISEQDKEEIKVVFSKRANFQFYV